MRKSAAVKLTLVPMLAASALAYAQAPGQDEPASAAQQPIGQNLPDDPPRLPWSWIEQAPATVDPMLMPPGMTPTIDDLTCDEDPNWQLRSDCVDGDGDVGLVGTGVVRGGYGGYFWTGGG